MSKLMVIAPVLLAASCAVHAGDTPPAPVDDSTASATAPAPAPSTPVEDAAATSSPGGEKMQVVEMKEFPEVLVCEKRTRAGTRIAKSVCYPRETYAAMQETKRAQALRYLDDLEREQRMLAIQQQAIQEQQRRQMAR